MDIGQCCTDLRMRHTSDSEVGLSIDTPSATPKSVPGKPFSRHEADPRPLALAGFASIILLVSMQNAGWISSLSWLGPLGLLSGIALILGEKLRTSRVGRMICFTCGKSCARRDHKRVIPVSSSDISFLP